MICSRLPWWNATREAAAWVSASSGDSACTRGALASSVAHDSHNIIVAGVAETDLRTAVRAVAAMGGGLAAVADGRILARLPLPVAGLMSQESVHAVSAGMDRLVRAARELGSPLKDPFMTLSFLALPVIPALKITDMRAGGCRPLRNRPFIRLSVRNARCSRSCFSKCALSCAPTDSMGSKDASPHP